ncbi:MAG: hypothetical protein Edafosvirus27_16, partial [Edafosvirus sp.]
KYKRLIKYYKLKMSHGNQLKKANMVINYL